MLRKIEVLGKTNREPCLAAQAGSSLPESPSRCEDPWTAVLSESIAAALAALRKGLGPLGVRTEIV